ncbi:MAG: hypothetical protein M1823_008740, partial [Watsoniomyces obsoletus]
LLLSNDYIFWRNKVKPKKKYDTSDPVRNRKIEENESFRQKFVQNTAWMRDQQPDAVARRKAAWEKAVKEGLGGYEEVGN